MTNKTRPVMVLSWVYYNGPEQGGGGFNWYETEDRISAEAAYEAEPAKWSPDRVRVRLLEISVPANLTGQELTDWLDDRIDDIESHLPALREIDTAKMLMDPPTAYVSYLPGDTITLPGEHGEGIKATVLSVESATKWIAGWNMPGYLPESEPAVFDDWQDAMNYLRDTISRFWDEDYDGADLPRIVHDKVSAALNQAGIGALDAKWSDVHEATGTATHGEEWSHVNGDTSLRFWIERADDTDFNTAGP